MIASLYWQSPSVQLWHSDAKDMSFLADESIHCVVTSPPYWGLRRYSGRDGLVWGGNPDCSHQWGAELYQRQRGSLHGVNAQAGNTLAGVSGVGVKQGQFCGHCGAWRGQLGLDPTPELYVEHLVQIFQEVRRVLRSDGVLWLNMGDSYAANRSYQVADSKHIDVGNDMAMSVPLGLKPLDLCNIPHRVASALQADGWFWRGTIIWEKSNPMPESVGSWRWQKHRVKAKSQDYSEYHQPGKMSSGEVSGGHRNRDAIGGVFLGGVEWADCPGCPKCLPNDGLVLRKGAWRPTTAHEYIFMLTKTDSYFCDQEAVREPVAESTIGRGPVDFGGEKGRNYQPSKDDPNFRNGAEQWGRTFDYKTSCANGRNLRTVWQFPTQPYSGAHFATFPEALPEKCILASTSEAGCCAKCGSPVVRIIDYESHYSKREDAHAVGNIPSKVDSTGWHQPTSNHLGFRPSCSCDAGIVFATVLDPFVGSGTTCLVAQKLGRKAIGVDFSKNYLALAQKRIESISLSLGGA